jgi:hypothetical protein
MIVEIQLGGIWTHVSCGGDLVLDGDVLRCSDCRKSISLATEPSIPALTAPGTSYPPLAEADAEQDSSGKRYPHTEQAEAPKECPKCHNECFVCTEIWEYEHALSCYYLCDYCKHSWSAVIPK